MEKIILSEKTFSKNSESPQLNYEFNEILMKYNGGIVPGREYLSVREKNKLNLDRITLNQIINYQN